MPTFRGKAFEPVESRLAIRAHTYVAGISNALPLQNPFDKTEDAKIKKGSSDKGHDQ
jgi:hypothetical protein